MPQIRPHQGLQIDGFTLGPMLHKGGFATIWDVTHPDHSGPMIMKVPIILDGDDAPTIVGFEVEQMIMPRLSGPHVPRLVAMGDFTAMPYIVTEFIPGGSLLRSFERGPRSLSTILEKSALMVEAVAALHAQLVIHLDLKPANFLQRDTGEMVCIDFGLARHDQLPDLLAEEFTIPMGTYPYIAPEQYLRQRNNPRSDLFALGAMIYELATGQMPFGQPEKLRQVRKRLWRDPIPPRALRPDLPEWLQEIILRALSVDPRRRYQTAAQMAFDLEHPAQVPLTARARKMRRDGWWTVWQRKRRMMRLTDLGPPPRLSQQGQVPILLVAVDLSPDMEPLADQLRQSLGRMLQLYPDARVVCVNVIKTARLGIDQMTDDEGNNLHVTRLVTLRHWAEGLDLPEERLTFTILEHPDPADALIDHATKLRANHILMGARGSGGVRRYLGSVSAKVVAEAGCSVTVMRVMGGRLDF
jgi:eukaryotic-like serine/threonine-protein kinase